MRRIPLLAALAATLAVLPAHAQEAVVPIADNSFLIEEAYNQEAGVVQHIGTFTMPRDGASWEFGFTQEWPLFSQEHQLSYGVPITHDSSGTGPGNLMLNYRYQALGVGGGEVAFAPRLSVLLPTSAASQGKGLGYELNLPLSTRLGNALVSHTNLGTTLAAGEPAEYFAGQSLIWLMTSRFNPLVEVVWRRGAAGDETTVNPGFRWAYNLGDTQLVPGLAVPVTFSAAPTNVAMFLYLSVEHPFFVAPERPASLEK